MEELVLLYFYVPESHLESVKQALFDMGVGKVGEYSCCCWQTKGIGQFLPSKDASPHIGSKHTVNQVEEYKVEVICKRSLLPRAITMLKKAHPYEEVPFGATVHLQTSI